MEITVTCHPWSLKITILGTKRVSRKVGAYQPHPSLLSSTIKESWSLKNTDM
jgi:hypothetical protein